MTERELRIGYIGLGAMGLPMAECLARAGALQTFWNRSPERGEHLEQLGVVRAVSAGALAADCDVILSCLLNTTAITEVYLGAGGVFDLAQPGSVIVEHGTFPPAEAQRIAREAERRGLIFVDAPVSGGSAAAQAGTLAIMAGGNRDTEQVVREATAPYTGVLEWVGESGSGLALKLVNQMLVSAHTAIAAEAASMIGALGIDPGPALKVLSGGWAQSAMLERNLPLTVEGDLTRASDASIGGIQEAQDAIIAIASDAGLDIPVFTEVWQRFAKARAAGWGDRDLAAIALLGK